jgi:hypothetical protein
MGILQALRAMVVAVPPLYGDVLPARPAPPVPSFDGRTAALRALRDYTCALTFHRAGGPGQPPIDFQVLPKNFAVDLPDDNGAADYAAGMATCVPTGRFRYDPTGLNTFLDPESFGVFGRGTALQVMSTYVEQLDLEFACALRQQRRAWKAGMEVAFAPGDGVAALRLRTRGYYGQPATFSLRDGALLDSQDEARGRRRVQLGLELRIQVVRLVDAVTLRPVPTVLVDADESTGAAVSPATALPPGA